MSYANFVLYSSVIPNFPKADGKGGNNQKRSGMTFSELLGVMKQMPH